MTSALAPWIYFEKIQKALNTFCTVMFRKLHSVLYCKDLYNCEFTLIFQETESLKKVFELPDLMTELTVTL